MTGHTSGDPAGRADGLLAVLPESLLVVVHLTVAASFVRLYDGPFFGDLACFVLVASALACATRRLRLPVAVVVLAPVVGVVLLATWLLFPETSWLGLPTGATWSAAGDALREARSAMAEVVAPADVLVGFQLAAGSALWAAVWFADWAAFRLRTPVEAVVPAAVLFTFGAVLGSGEHRVATTAAFVGAVLAFVAAHRAREAQLEHAWLATSDGAGPRALLRAGGGLALACVLVGALVGSNLPGTDADPLVRWRDRGGGGGDRVTLSPIVDLKRRLVEQSEVHVFTVRADRPAYWRLTALDEFDGRLWTSGGRFGEADGRLEGSAQVPGERRITQRYEIRALSSIWVPAALEARAVGSSTGPLRWDPVSATLIVDAELDDSDGLTYEVTSSMPVHRAEDLRAASGPDPDDIEERFEALPADLPPVVATTAATVTAGATTRYDQALALQDWFRTEFTYSTDIPSGHDDEAIVSFLDGRVGYCEQFAGTYAAMARSLGIPARVAVGFTQGDPDPANPGTYRVRGRHAHAWPEVWFPGAGWVPFEPTPTRGIPGAEPYTRVPAAQEDGRSVTPPAPPRTTSTTTPTPGRTPPAAAPTTTAPDDVAVAPAGGDRAGGPGLPGWQRGLVAVIAALGAWVALVLVVSRLRAGRRRTDRPADAVLWSWHDACAAVARLTGTRRRSHETHDEVARRARGDLRPLGLDEPFSRLADLATVAAWNPDGVGAADEAAARSYTAAVTREARSREPLLRRIGRALSWQQLRPTAT